MSETSKAGRDDLVRYETREGVTTLTLNNPKRLNGWTMPMLEALRAAMGRAEADEATQVVILTGTDPYYCAGVNLSAVVKLDHPARLHAFIAEQNEQLFDLFISFPKPIIVAVNGPAIGASVTSATLCDAIIASERATFSTPFAKLGVTPEGCSSVLFAKLMGEATAQRMLGSEGWQPTGAEAVEAGLADQVVPHDELLEVARATALTWIAEGHTRSYKAGMTREALQEINARESQLLAGAFLSEKFLRGQFEFLWKKQKHAPAMVFLGLLVTRPLWSLLLPA